MDHTGVSVGGCWCFVCWVGGGGGGGGEERRFERRRRNKTHVLYSMQFVRKCYGFEVRSSEQISKPLCFCICC